MESIKNNETVKTPAELLKEAEINKFKEPFKYPEWRRELVASRNLSTNKTLYLPYYLYNNIKLRTKDQIKEKLEEFNKNLLSKGQPESKLSINNFTFKRSPIGLDDSSKEIIKKKERRRKGKLRIVKKVANKNSLFPLETLSKSSNKLSENAPGVSSLNVSGYSPPEVMESTECESCVDNLEYGSIDESSHTNKQDSPPQNSKKRKRSKEKNSNKKIKIINDISDPKYKEPFKHAEFQREIIYNVKANSRNEKPVITIHYYLRFNLEDKEIRYKFKSSNKISDKIKEFDIYLKNKGDQPSGLTKDNFTFIQKPIGLNNNQEKILYAIKPQAVKTKLLNTKNNQVKQSSSKYLSTLIKPSKLSGLIASENLKNFRLNKNNKTSTIKLSTATSTNLSGKSEINASKNMLLRGNPVKISELYNKSLTSNCKKTATTSTSILKKTISASSKISTTESLLLKEDEEEITKTEKKSSKNNCDGSIKKPSSSVKQTVCDSGIRRTENVPLQKNVIEVIELDNEPSRLNNHTDVAQNSSSTLKKSGTKDILLEKDAAKNITKITEHKAKSSSINHADATTKKTSPTLSNSVNDASVSSEIEIIELVNEPSIKNSETPGGYNKVRSLFQEMTCLQTSACFLIENKLEDKELEHQKLIVEKEEIEKLLKSEIIKSKNLEENFKNLEEKLNEEKKTNAFLQEKIKKIEYVAEVKSIQNKKMQNHIDDLTELHNTEINNLKTQAKLDKTNYEIRLENEAKRYAVLEDELKEFKKIKDIMFEYLKKNKKKQI